MNARELRELLALAGLSQVQAAKAIGVSPRAMRRYVSLDRKAWRRPPGPVVYAMRALARQ